MQPSNRSCRTCVRGGNLCRDLKSPNILVDDNWTTKAGGRLGVALPACDAQQACTEACDAMAGRFSCFRLPGAAEHSRLRMLRCPPARLQICDLNLAKLLDSSTNSSSLAALNPRWLVRSKLCMHVDMHGVLHTHMHLPLLLGGLTPAAAARLPLFYPALHRRPR